MNITYLLGAGASAEALPIVGKNFNDRFILFCKIVLDSKYSSSTNTTYKDFIWKVINELPKHYSIDTFARKLSFQKTGQEYEAIKNLISYYLLYEQATTKSIQVQNSALQSTIADYSKLYSKNIDPRYDVLYAALLDKETNLLPHNINFISWNYDVQLELSYGSFLNLDLYETFKALKVYPSPHGKTNNEIVLARLLKINGTAGLYFEHTSNPRESSYQFFNEDSPVGIVNTCINTMRDLLEKNLYKECLLHFAWENKTEVQSARLRAKQIMGITDILIVIGYSFPVYNRKIDKEILSGLKTNVKRIYLQVFPNDFEKISERLKAATNFSTEILNPKDLDQFYIPDEMF